MSTKYKTNKLNSSNIETPRVTTPRMILNKLRQCYRPETVATSTYLICAQVANTIASIASKLRVDQK